MHDVKNDQKRLISELHEIKKENNECGSKEQKDVIYNNEILYEARENAIKFYDNYSSMIFEAKHEPIKGPWLKILTIKEMI